MRDMSRSAVPGSGARLLPPGRREYDPRAGCREGIGDCEARGSHVVERAVYTRGGVCAGETDKGSFAQ